MEDSDVLPKRRKLDPPEEEPSGQKVKDAFSLDKESSEKKPTSYSIPNHHKKIKWNFKLVHPEVLKCCRSIVDGLDRAGPGGKRSDENESTPLLQNDLTSREKKKESALALKRKRDPDIDGVKNCVDKETTSAACVLPKNCHTFLTISHEKLGPCKEIKNGCTTNNHAPTQQLPLERLILDPPTKDRLHHEIRKIIKDLTREAMERAESLKSRISTLESENSWLKHKVTLLYGALRKELNRRKQNKVPTTTSTNSTLQDKPQVKSNESGCLEALLQPQPHSKTAIGNKTKDEASHCLQRTIATDSSLDSEAVDKTHQKDKTPPAVGSEPKIRPLHNTVIPSVEDCIANDQTTKSVSTGSIDPIASIGQDTTLSSIYRPNQAQTLSKTPVQTGFGPPTKTTLHNPVLSPVVTLHHKGINVPSNGETSNSAPNPVSLLCQVLDEILASSGKGVPHQNPLNPLCRLEAPTLPKNVHKPLTHTATGIMTSRTTPTGNEEVLCKQHSSDQNRKISMNLSTTQTEKTCQGDNKTLIVKHGASGYLSPISLDQGAFKVESKHRELLGSTCIVDNERKKEKSLLASNGACYYKSNADTQLSVCQLQSNIAAVASPVSSNSQLTKSIPENSSVVGSSGQSVGVLDGINMLAQAAGLGSRTTDSKSSKNQVPPLGRTPGESNKIHTGDLRQQGLNTHVLEGYCVNSKSQPSQRSSISQAEEPQRHKCVVGQHVSGKGPLKGHCTNVITRHVDEHQKTLKVKDQNVGKTELLNPPEPVKSRFFQHEERSTHPQKDNITPGNERFCNGNQELASVSQNKFRTMPYHANSEEDNISPSPTRFYNSRECQEHPPTQAQNTTLARNHVVSTPRYLPYPPIRPKEQKIPFVAIRSKIQYVPKANKRQSPKPDGLPRLTPPLNGAEPKRPYAEEKSANNGNEEMFEQLPKFSRPPETSSSEVRFTASCSSSANTSSKYNKESLLLQLLHSDRVPYIPQYFPTSNLRTVNTSNLPSKSSETCKRYAYLQPKRHVQSSIQNPEESSLCNSDKTKSAGITLPCKPGLIVGEGSSNDVSFHPTSTPNPRIELSHSCQRYITQLRNSPHQSHEDSINGTAKLLPYTESKSLDLKNSSQQSLKFPSPYSSMKQQATCQQEGYDAHETHLQTSLSEHKKDSNNLPQYQRPLYHHKKITNKRLQEHLSEEWLKCCSGTPIPVSELSKKGRLPCTAVSGEPRKAEINLL